MMIHNQSKNIVFEKKIKRYLINDREYHNWEEFVDKQQMGDCQLVVAGIKYAFPKVKGVFGEIKNDKGKWMTHHWIEYGGKIYEFNKGTLKNHIDFIDIYDIYPESKYKPIRKI